MAAASAPTTLPAVAELAPGPSARSSASTAKVPKFAYEMAAAASAMTITSVFFNPFDVVKTKLQTQNQLSRDASKKLYTGTLHCAKRTIAEDGLIRGLWLPGLAASVMRDIVNGGIRMGLYPTTVRAVHDAVPWGKQSGAAVPSFGTRVLAGLVTGFSGAFVANATDVVKVRLQAESGTVRHGVYVTGLYQGKAPSPNTFACLWELGAKEGLRSGIFRGLGANCARAALVTSSQMPAYDTTKMLLAGSGVELFQQEGVRIACASFMSGVSAATVAAPVDLVRSRVMDDAHAGAKQMYSGALDCAWRTVKAEGPFALWKGWVPSYLRLGPHFMVSLPLLELLRGAVFGLPPL